MMCMFYEWNHKINNYTIGNLLVRYKLQKKNFKEWSIELKMNILLLQCMLKWFPTGPFFRTGHSRVTVLAFAFIMRTILGIEGWIWSPWATLW